MARALSHLDRWVQSGRVPGAAAMVLQDGQLVGEKYVGWSDWERTGGDVRPIDRDTIFPVTSGAKPVAATALMTLVERGEVLLEDPVTRFVSEFDRLGKEGVTVFHLLTHTSGLPDSVPNNDSLRKALGGLPSFVRSACRCELAFTPGSRISFSNVGYLMIGEIVERVTGQAYHQYVADAIATPLGLVSTTMRPHQDAYARIARIRLDDERAATRWDINSHYWRQLASPWAGLYTSARDTALFCQHFLDELRGTRSVGTARVVGAASVRLMVANHTRGLPTREGAEDCGLGWIRLKTMPGSWAGNLASDSTFGHYSGSGSLVWVDPDRSAVCVVLTNQTTDWVKEGRRFAALSNAIQAALD